MRWAKVLGLAGLAGVAGATVGGIAIAREQRKRSSYTPEEIRSKLRARVDGEAPPPS